MAIGDNNNSNLFGTNYNAEEEERKKALLAAQNARIGSGETLYRGATGIQDIAGMQGVPQGGTLDPIQGARDLLIGRQFNRGEPVRISDMGSLIQEPGTSAFSMEAAGQVNPMMEPQSLATESVSNLITNNPFISTGGAPTTAQPNVNFNAISIADATNPAFEGMSAGEIINKFNEPGYTTPPLVEQTFFERPKSRFRGFVDPIIDEFTSAGQDAVSAAKVGYQFFSDPSRPTLQSLTEQEKQNRSAGLADLQARNEESIRRGEAFLSQDGTTQAPPGASALGATQGVTPPVETPSEGAQGQTAALDPTSDEAILANRAQREAQFAPAGGLTTVGGASLSEFLSGQAMPEQGFTREESPLGGRGVTLTQDQMNILSAEREARLDARPDFGEAVSDRDRRAARGDGISMADQTAMAKANARGASPSEVARGNQVANALGVELKTGQPLQATGSLTFDQQLALRKQNFAEGKFDYELAKDAQATYTAGIEASQKATTKEAQADTAGRTMVSAISNMNDAMTRMGGRSGEFFGSGFFGKAASFMPGTSAYDQVADVEFLQSNVALNAMSELKELSPTGSTGFGALSEKELRVLTDKYANLNPFTSPGLFQSNLKQLQGEFNNMLDNAWNKHSKEYSPEAANAIYGNRGGSASSATGAPSQAVPNDRNVASAADTLLSDPKYN